MTAIKYKYCECNHNNLLHLIDDNFSVRSVDVCECCGLAIVITYNSRDHSTSTRELEDVEFATLHEVIRDLILKKMQSVIDKNDDLTRNYCLN